MRKNTKTISMNKSLHRMLLTLVVASAGTTGWAIGRQSLVSYAATLSGKSGAELKAALYTLMQPERILDYGSGSGCTWDGFWYTDRNQETNECYNRYSSKKFYFTSHDNSAISGMNIEHSFPKSWWGGTKNNAYKDLYNLYPSDAQANSSKSNYAMGVVTTVKSSEEGYDKVGYGTIDGSSQQCWEPGDQFKGEFARSYMYMAIVYSNLTFTGTGLQTMVNEDYPGMKEWATSLYIAWGKQDRVSNMERDRNNAIAKLEGNRNLLVDYPYLADYVWGDSVGVAFDPSTSVSTADDDDRYMETQPIDPDVPDTPDEGQWQFEKVATVTSGASYLLVANNSGTLYAAAPINNGSKNYGYLSGRKVTDVDGVITLATDTLAFTFEANGDGYLITDNKGRYIYHQGSYSSYQVSTSLGSGYTWTVTPQSDGTFRIEQDGYYAQYSTKYYSYGCYNSEQGIMPMLYQKCEEVDGIRQTYNADEALKGTKVYNLSGQLISTSLSKLPQGLYIINGKKMLMK